MASEQPTEEPQTGGGIAMQNMNSSEPLTTDTNNYSNKNISQHNRLSSIGGIQCMTNY